MTKDWVVNGTTCMEFTIAEIEKANVANVDWTVEQSVSFRSSVSLELEVCETVLVQSVRVNDIDHAGSKMFKPDCFARLLSQTRAKRIYLQQGLFGAETLKPTVLCKPQSGTEKRYAGGKCWGSEPGESGVL